MKTLGQSRKTAARQPLTRLDPQWPVNSAAVDILLCGFAGAGRADRGGGPAQGGGGSRVGGFWAPERPALLAGEEAEPGKGGPETETVHKDAREPGQRQGGVQGDNPLPASMSGLGKHYTQPACFTGHQRHSTLTTGSLLYRNMEAAPLKHIIHYSACAA